MNKLIPLFTLLVFAYACSDSTSVNNDESLENEAASYTVGKTPLPVIEGIKDYGIDEISEMVGESKAKSIAINEEEFTQLLDSYRDQANSEYYGVFSFRRKVNDEYVYHYYVRDINFSEEILEEASGEKALFVVVPGKDMAGIHRTYVAWIPNSQKAKDQMALWALPTETQPNPLDVGTIPDNMKSMGCDWVETVPGGYVIIGGSVTYWPPIVEWICENPDTPVEYEEPDMGGGGSGVCPTPGGCGFADDCPDGEDCSVDKPCPGDPVMNPEIAPTDGQGVNGGRYGAHRYNSVGYHQGLDIKADVNSPVHAMHSGNASSGYSSDFGHYIIITTVINGKTYFVLYAHLNLTMVNSGYVNQGDQIGLSGRTGNANNAPHAHVHIETRTADQGDSSYNDYTAHDPESLMGTKFDAQGNPSNSGCTI
ncbi:MAG: M23 family metallopeptidase [Balneola sp.]|nr:MAG: M23 family metallopeptidase [Balneola sp.]